MLKIFKYILRYFYTLTIAVYKQLKDKTYIEPNVIINRKTIVKKNCVIHSKVSIPSSYIDNNTYIGKKSKMEFTKIGKFCSIGPEVMIIAGRHPINMVSTHPAFYSLNLQCGFTYVKVQKFDEIKFVDKLNEFYVEIGSDVWIGNKAMILGGIRIGNGSIIAAGAVVTKDVEPYSIVAGVPAIVIKMRFKKEHIDILNNFCWWEKDENWIKKNANSFENIDEFIKIINNE
jgi:acetyltransferase-like isoleucine patch superfamily enzyme